MSADTISDRIQKLRREMKKRKISVYLIPTSDFHESEYVSDYFKVRQYMTGFTGSAGTAVITQTKAGLWTDGRYFIQAQKQLAGTEIVLYRMGMEGVPTAAEFIRENLEQNTYLGFDGRVLNASLGHTFLVIAREKQAQLYWKEDLAGMIWKDRPQFPVNPAFLLDEVYTGRSIDDKISAVRRKMEEAGATVHVLSSLCDIAWLLNIRGGDISHVPVVMSYLILTRERCCFYVNLDALSREIVGYFIAHKVDIRSYADIYEDLKLLEAGERVLLESGKINLSLKMSIPEDVEIIDRSNPEELMKAVKNPVEIKNIRKAHVKDGVAFTKFCYWLKQNIGKQEITELSAAEYLKERRMEQEHFVNISFDTISAYGANAAMMHYAPGNESNAVLKPEGFLLVDSGGHYLEGSTDITRNIVLGPLSKEEKQMYTAVVRANLNLANARFLYGCSGLNLDILARGPLWQQGMDYRCGTGHGNGYLLNVHEGPNGFRWRTVPERRDDCILEEGMVTTDEPGVYVEGKYGIRIENELLCRKWIKNEYGQFMQFENLTYAPIDLEGILPEEMTGTEQNYLNQYHKKVYEALSPYLNESEKNWLKEATREI